MDYVLLSLQGAYELLLFFLGASLFSFLNVILDRVPQGLPVFRGRSHCPACGAVLQGRDEIPCISWLWLRGKCRFCGEKISFRYLGMELWGGALAVGCTAIYGAPWCGVYAPNARAVLLFAVLSVLTGITVLDRHTGKIPDVWILSLAVCGGASLFVFPEISPLSRLIGVFCVSLPLLLCALALPGAFGGGDIKLMAAAGLLLGWRGCVLAAFLAVFAGGCAGFWILFQNRHGTRPTHLAFGPFLCGGIAAALLAQRFFPTWFFLM